MLENIENIGKQSTIKSGNFKNKTMKEQFLNYSQSLALKELGFDEPCLGAWAEHGFMTPNDVSTLQDDVIREDIENTQDENMCLAPTLSQAFRFFRDKYELPSWIYTSNNKEFWYSILKDGRMIVRDYKPFDKYEEAENACIDKLIEISKKYGI